MHGRSQIELNEPLQLLRQRTIELDEPLQLSTQGIIEINKPLQLSMQRTIELNEPLKLSKHRTIQLNESPLEVIPENKVKSHFVKKANTSSQIDLSGKRSTTQLHELVEKICDLDETSEGTGYCSQFIIKSKRKFHCHNNNDESETVVSTKRQYINDSDSEINILNKNTSFFCK